MKSLPNAADSPIAMLRMRQSVQDRSSDKRRLIGEAAGSIIAEHGIAGTTHRLIAGRAGVSLAATTYHFERKIDIIDSAAQLTLGRYDRSFDRTLERLREEGGSPRRFRAYFTALMRNTAGRARVEATCWGEIALAAPRRAESLTVVQDWFARTIETWRKITAECGLDRSQQRAIFCTDVLIGVLFLIVGLGLTEETIGEVIGDGRDLAAFQPLASSLRDDRGTVRASAKAAATRGKILAATLDILKTEGPGAVTCRTVAARAHVTKAALFYYFASIADLIAAAQHELLDQLKDRYRLGLVRAGGSDISVERLIDRTAAVFLREATEYASETIANYSVWLRADGEPAVRELIWAATVDQHRSWRHVLERWKPQLEPIDPLLGQALFLGKLVRIIATGSRIEDLAGIRQEFAFGLHDILSGPEFGPT